MPNLLIIKDILKEKNIKIEDFAPSIGMTTQGFHKLIRSNSTKIETLELIAKKLNVSIKLFFTSADFDNPDNRGAKGLYFHTLDTLKAESKSATIASKEENDLEETIYTVMLLPISAQAGSLNDFIAKVKESDCERIISPIRGADFAMSVAGDSMSPEYPNGSQILIKKINEKAFIEWGKVYVLDTNNGTVIKIVNDSQKEGYIRCTSINADQKRYEPFDIPLAEVLGMYRVMMCMAIK